MIIQYFIIIFCEKVVKNKQLFTKAGINIQKSQLLNKRTKLCKIPD